MRRHLAYAAAGAVVLALTSCGDDPEPQVADPTSTPSSSSSPSESAAAEKEPWEEKTDDGAVAFVAHWLEVMNEAENSGDTVAFRELATDQCQTCDRIASYTDQLYESGGYSKSQAWSVQSVSEPRKGPERSTLIAVNVLTSDQKLKESSTSPVRVNEASEVTLTAYVRWTGSAWAMSEVELVQ
ncbi:hypothetical protein BKA08_001785 [Nocardioides marinisabuli]|uniref:DUF6318 domain-containing protein n=1 Tax=Nocardioides marinisabuli TaxID=419476 RepID=A0A7Y9JPZ8_9ACTN|nr:DUF6318 family protein [Nocardioides marinisabuli]NYD57547.1 hypothetical protein [Nocardioides marinisabuli]